MPHMILADSLLFLLPL